MKTILTLFLLMVSQISFGRQYLQIEGEGLISNTLNATPQKIIKVFSVGGMVTIRPSVKLTKNHYFRSYFKGSMQQNKMVLPENGHQIYLNPNQLFFIDILDRVTDSLVTRYQIERLTLIPKIKFYTKNKLTHTWPFEKRDNELKLSAGQEIAFTPEQNSNNKNLAVEYTLLNLKTKKLVYNTVKPGHFEHLNLDANTEYELKVNYVVQKESSGIGYLYVKPYWYQSTLFHSIVLMAFLGLAYLLINRRFINKIKTSKKKQQDLEQAAIRLQSLLNPHFTFNALSTIQGLMNTNRIDEANTYLQEFSSLLRQTLAKSQQVFNSLDQELDMMRMYIRLEAFRFNFSWTIEIVEELNTSVIEVPTLLLQPLIENSIKHGLSGLNDQGQLTIICKQGQKKDTFVIVVKDNGTWMDKPIGYGISLTKERIKTINTMRKEQMITLNFNKGVGTEAILTFNHWINT